MFSLICVWIDDWVNNREAGDLRRQRGHYDVIVMAIPHIWGFAQCQWSMPEKRGNIIVVYKPFANVVCYSYDFEYSLSSLFILVHSDAIRKIITKWITEIYSTPLACFVTLLLHISMYNPNKTVSFGKTTALPLSADAAFSGRRKRKQLLGGTFLSRQLCGVIRFSRVRLG